MKGRGKVPGVGGTDGGGGGKGKPSVGGKGQPAIGGQGAASSLHALLPATGAPSFWPRIIEVVSINSASLLPTILLHTTCEGKLLWFFLIVRV